jgi:hypothetical protein
MSSELKRPKTRSRAGKLLLAALGASALLSGFAASPALADHWDRHYHRGWERHERYYHGQPYIYYVEPGYYGPPPGYYAPPVYYAPPPPPPVYYGAPSLNVVIPIR